MVKFSSESSTNLHPSPPSSVQEYLVPTLLPTWVILIPLTLTQSDLVSHSLSKFACQWLLLRLIIFSYLYCLFIFIFSVAFHISQSLTYLENLDDRQIINHLFAKNVIYTFLKLSFTLWHLNFFYFYFFILLFYFT